MGPKKKGKKSKAELEAERLEAERLEALAAAERERKAEEERQAAAEAARALAAQRRATREEELAALASEVAEEEAWYERHALKLAEVRRSMAEERGWAQWLSCSKLPHAESDRELNTYLSELADDKVEMLEEVLVKVATTQKIATALGDLEADAMAQRDVEQVGRCRSFSSDLRSAIVTLMDRATAHVLQHADAGEKNEIMETGCDCFEPSDDEGQSTSRNVAVSSPDPRSLEHKASSTIPLVSGASGFARSAFSSISLVGREDATKKRIRIVRCETDDEDDDRRPASRLEFEARGAVRVGVWANMSIKTIRGPFKQLNFADVGLHLDLPKTLGTQRLGARIVFFPYDHVPNFYVGTADKEEDEPPEGLMRAADMLVLGVVLVEILDLPPMGKEIKPRLVVQQLTELATSVRVQPFPPGAEHGARVVVDRTATPALNQYLRVRLKVPRGVVLPDDALRAAWWDTARGHWIDGTTSQVEFNEAKREVGFNATRSGALALVQPRTLDLPYASWALDALPAGPPTEHEEACCRFSLVTPRFRIVVVVSPSGNCRLVEPANFVGLAGQSLSPGRLLRALCRAGVNVVPDENDAVVATSVKSAALERKLCSEIAALASSFDFRHVPPSLAPSSDRVAIAVRETDAFIGSNPAGDLEFYTLLVEKDAGSKTQREAPDVEGTAPEIKCALVVGPAQVPDNKPAPKDEPALDVEQNNEATKTEPDEHAEGQAETAPVLSPANDTGCEPRFVLDDNLLPGKSSHVGIMRCLRDVSSVEAMDRVSQTPIVFQEAVTELLHLTRPFSFL